MHPFFSHYCQFGTCTSTGGWCGRYKPLSAPNCASVGVSVGLVFVTKCILQRLLFVCMFAYVCATANRCETRTWKTWQYTDRMTVSAFHVCQELSN